MTTDVTIDPARILAKRERYLGDLLYAYDVIVWDPANGGIVPVCYGSDYGDSADFRKNRDLYTLALDPALLPEIARFCRPRLAENAYNSEVRRLGKLDYGRTVEVVRGRKIPVGTTGIVRWMGEVNYGRSKWTAETRIGISVNGSSQLSFTSAHNVEVVITDHPDIYDFEVEYASLDDISAINTYLDQLGRIMGRAEPLKTVLR